MKSKIETLAIQSLVYFVFALIGLAIGFLQKGSL
jgi:hypothetical protein